MPRESAIATPSRPCPRCGRGHTHNRLGGCLVPHDCPHGRGCGDGNPEWKGESEWCEGCEKRLRKAWAADRGPPYFETDPFFFRATAWAGSQRAARSLLIQCGYASHCRGYAYGYPRVERAPWLDAPMGAPVPEPRVVRALRVRGADFVPGPPVPAVMEF